MARMIPDYSTDEIVALHGSSAEARVYAALRERLPASNTVLYSVPWIEQRRGTSPLNGEADFVVLDPGKGMLVGEVKGGQVEVYSGGRWLRRIGGETEEFTSPFEQALTSLKVLQRYCSRKLGLDFRRLVAGHFVAFPDSSVHLPDIGPGAPREITLYGDELADIRDRIGEVFEYWKGDQQPWDSGTNWIDRITKLLMPTRVLHPSLGAQVSADEQKLLELTAEQSRILGLLGHVTRARIEGAAGTGKTALAMQKSRQLAEDGSRTLLTCFNRLLAERMASQLADQSNLTVLTYHELCRSYAEKAGLPLPDRNEQMPSQYFSEHLPELLLESLEILQDNRFDALVVDESQDFHPDWWATLTLLLSDPDECPIYVFNDAGQNLFQESVFAPQDLQQFTLNENVRNTRRIHEFAESHTTSSETLSRGPEGRPVEFIEAEDERKKRQAISRILHRLVNEEGVERGDIAIITGRAASNSCLSELDRLGAFALSRADQSVNEIVVESLWRFKGLESPLVILVDFPISVASGARYVAATRAQSHLIVVGSDEENRAWHKETE